MKPYRIMYFREVMMESEVMAQNQEQALEMFHTRDYPTGNPVPNVEIFDELISITEVQEDTSKH